MYPVATCVRFFIAILQGPDSDTEASDDDNGSTTQHNLKSTEDLEEKWMTVHSDKFKLQKSDDSGENVEKWTTMRSPPNKSDLPEDLEDDVVITSRVDRVDSIQEEESRLREIKRILEEKYVI